MQRTTQYDRMPVVPDDSRVGTVCVEINQPQQQFQYGGNTYQNQNQNQGQGWHNNQNYGWRNNQNSMPPPQVSKLPIEKKMDLEEALAQMCTSHTTFMNETKVNMQNQSMQLNNQVAKLRNLEVKMG